MKIEAVLNGRVVDWVDFKIPARQRHGGRKNIEAREKAVKIWAKVFLRRHPSSVIFLTVPSKMQ